MASFSSTPLDDALGTLFDGAEAAALRFTPDRDGVSVAARTVSALGTGLRAHAFRAADAITQFERGVIAGLRHGATFSTAVGLVNDSRWPMDVYVSLRDDAGAELDVAVARLEPFGYVRLPDVYEGVATGEHHCGIVVTTTESIDGAFYAWAVITEATVGDEIIVPAVRLPR